MLRTGHRLASSPASNGGFPNKTNVRTARVSSIVPRAMVTIIKNANGWEEKCKKCFLCRSHYSRRADEPGNGRIPAVFAGIPDYSGCLLGSSSGMGAHITRPNGICCCCCCPSDLIYTRITSNIDPDDWDEDLTDAEIRAIQEQLGEDLEDMELGEDPCNEEVEFGNLGDLDEEERGSTNDVKAEAPPQTLDPNVLTEHVNGYQPPIEKQASEKLKLTAEPKPKSKPRKSKREVQEIKERTRTNLLKEEVSIETSPTDTFQYDINALIDDEVSLNKKLIVFV
ncbi:hypothetical protein AAMO2058_000871100 [Amorphochlora amoebiformis]